MKSNRMPAFREACSISLCLLAGLSACSRSAEHPTASNSVVQSAEKPIHYVAASEQPIPEGIQLSAKVQPDPTKVFRIFPPASGRILEVTVKPGDAVSRGQTLAMIDSSDAATARSDYAKAKVEAERASQAADREKVLLDHGAVAEKDYIDARAQSDSAVAELARAKQRLELLNVALSANSDRVPLLSPAHGVVLNVSAAPGEFSKSLESADSLITIADLSSVWIVGDVFEKDIATVQSGKKVTITFDAYPGEQWTGRIDSLSGALDQATRTLKVRVTLENAKQRLKPEMFAAIHVDTGTRNAVVVPASAVIHEGQTTTVFVQSGGKAEQQSVTTGQTVDGKVEILSGLQPGQQVAIDGAELLTGGPSEQ
jgi:cobalt-zinc-cadmium efflux system membrane fusion protein